MRLKLLVAFVSCSAATFGEVWTWTGVRDSHWTNAANWTLNGSAAAFPPGRYLSSADGKETGAFDSTVEFGAVAEGNATTIDLDGFWDVSNIVVKADAPQYQFGTSSSQVLAVHLTNGAFKVEAGARAPAMTAQFGAWRYGGVDDSKYFPKVINDSSETLVFSKMFYIEEKAKAKEKSIRFEGSGNVKISGLCTYRQLIHIYLYQTNGAKLIWDCSVENFNNYGGIRSIRNNNGWKSEIEITENGLLSGYPGMGPFIVGGELTLSGPGTYRCNIGIKNSSNATGGWKYIDQHNSGAGVLNVRCKVTSAENNDGYKAGWTIYSDTGVTRFDGEVDNQMTGAAKILPTSDYSSNNVRPTYSVNAIGNEGEKGPLGYAGVVIAGGGRLLYTGGGETCTRPLCITNRVPAFQNKPTIDMVPYAVLEQGGTGKLVFNSQITSSGINLNGTTIVDSTLELVNSTAQEAELGSVLADNVDAGKLNVVKTGSGMWRLSNANTYTGSTVIKGGALVIGEDGSIDASSGLELKGGDLIVESGRENGKTFKLPAITVPSGVNRIEVADGVAVTASGLSVRSGKLDVRLAGTATFKVAGLAALPANVTVNGSPASLGEDGMFMRRTYDEDVAIAARGGRIPNSSDEVVGIAISGYDDAGPVTLADGLASASVKTLVQKSDTPAVVALSAGQSLSSGVIAVEGDKASLTIGTAAGAGTVASASSASELVFDNASCNPITVLSTLNVSESSTIASVGDGLVRLWWSGDWSGVFDIRNGTVALTNETDITFNSVLKGTGIFRKEGSGAWTMNKLQHTTFEGDFAVAGGVVSFNNSGVFGNNSKGVLKVLPGATLKPSQNLSFPETKRVHLAGNGADGSGAVNFGSYTVYMPTVVLDGDTSIAGGGTSSSLLLTHDKKRGTFDMNGYSLTKSKDVGLYAYSLKVLDPGSFLFKPHDVSGNDWNIFYIYGDTDLGGEDAPPVEASVGTRIYLDGTSIPVRRKLRVNIPADSQYAEVSLTGGIAGGPDGVNTNYANWTGPVEIVNADTILSFNPWDAANADRYLTVAGPISGNGNVNIGHNTKSGSKGHVIFGNPSNTYKGSTVLDGGSGSSLTLLHPGSLPDWSKLQVYSCGRVGVAAGEGLFTADDVLTAANSSAQWGKKTGNGCSYWPCTLAVNTSYAPERKFTVNLTEESITRKDGFTLGHDGTGELSVTGSWTTPVDFSCYEGILKYSGTGVKTLGTGLVTGNWSLSSGEVLIEDAEDVRFTPNAAVTLGGHDSVKGAAGRMTIRDSRVSRLPVDGAWNSSTAFDSLVVGYFGSGIVSIEGASVVTNRHVIGYDESARGAVYQRAGRVVELGMSNAEKGCQCPVVGHDGYGYYELTDGYQEVFGKQYFGMGPGAHGVFLQKGGYIDHILPWIQNVDRNWILANGSNSVAVIQMEGGIITNRADVGLSVGADSRTYFTVEGGECIILRPANPNRGKSGGSLTVLNLNGGVFGAWNFARALSSYPEGATVSAFCNFNGGTFKAVNSAAAFESLFGTPGGGDWHEAIDRVTVYERGATICVPSALSASVNVPLSAPEGNGVSSVAWSDTGVKYVGSPVVEIIGDGTGASAFAEFDSVKGEVTGIKVTSPGCNYTWAKAVIRYGNEAPVTNTAVSLAEFKSGSFTKTGAGTLALNVANSYGGDTVIEEGTLSVNAVGAIPEGSAIVLKGGVLVAGSGIELPAATFRFDLLAPVVYPGAFAFPAGSAIEIANLDKADKAAGSHVIATFNDGLSGMPPAVANRDEMPPRWNLIKSGKSLKLRYSRGIVLSIR